MTKQARVGLIGEHIVIRDCKTQQEIASTKITSPNLKDWMRKIEQQKNCKLTNIDWANKTDKHWIYL